LDLPETRHLVAFTKVLQTGGFTRAAEALNLTQSALSHQIKTLEEQLGVQVFARIGKRTILTQAGEILLKHATVVLRELADASQSLLELRDPGRGRLRISAAGYSCYLLLPRILREFKSAYPRVELSVAADYTGEAVQHLLEGILDIAILVAPPPVRGLAFEPLAEDELFVIAPADHPWAKRRRVRWAELATQVLITYNKASITHQLLMHRLAEERSGVPETMEVREAEAVTEMVKVGLGIAVLPHGPETFVGDQLRPGSTVTSLQPDLHPHLPRAVLHPHGGWWGGWHRYRQPPKGRPRGVKAGPPHACASIPTRLEPIPKPML
jgi:DNA-binding transcriptional LysR family regulator